MKHIVLSILLLGVFSCSSHPVTNEVAVVKSDRSVSSDEYQKVVEIFRKPRADFNTAVNKIKAADTKKNNDLLANETVKACKADTIAYRFFSNSCTKSLVLCKAVKLSSFYGIAAQYATNIYQFNSAGQQVVEEQLRKSSQNSAYYKRILDILVQQGERMKVGYFKAIDDYSQTRGLVGFATAFSGAKDTYDKKDDFTNCLADLELDVSMLDSYQEAFDALIPQ